MYKSLFNLDEKTILIAGVLSHFHKALAMQFLEFGSNTVIVHKNLRDIPRFTQNIIDSNSIKPGYGRIKDISSSLESKEEASDILTQSAEFFGGVDVYIDTHHFSPQEQKKETLMTKKALEFLKGRVRSRLIYCFPDVKTLKDERFPAHQMKKFQEKVKNQALELKEFNITVNALFLGSMEDYLLDRFPKTRSLQEAMNQIQKIAPQSKIMNHIDVSKTLIFIASAMSSALNGQSLFLT